MLFSANNAMTCKITFSHVIVLLAEDSKIVLSSFHVRYFPYEEPLPAKPNYALNFSIVLSRTELQGTASQYRDQDPEVESAAYISSVIYYASRKSCLHEFKICINLVNIALNVYNFLSPDLMPWKLFMQSITGS